MQLRSLVGLTLFLAFSALPLAAKPLFGVPMQAVVASSEDLDQLADHLSDYSEQVQARPDLGYDWVFPQIYAKTTRIIRQATLRPEFFQHPAIVRREIAQFYELYAVNRDAYSRGLPLEPQWERAARLSRALGKLDLNEDANERNGAALIQSLAAIYAHICVDLPRALLIVEQKVGDTVSLAEIKADFFRSNALFIPVVKEMIQDAKITPRVLKACWKYLPGWAQELVVGSKTPVGAGAWVRAVRRFAWLRFRSLRLRRKHRDEARNLPDAEAVTPLWIPELPEGPRAPGASSLSPETESSQHFVDPIDKAFHLFLKTGSVR